MKDSTRVHYKLGFLCVRTQCESRSNNTAQELTFTDLFKGTKNIFWVENRQSWIEAMMCIHLIIIISMRVEVSRFTCRAKKSTR